MQNAFLKRVYKERYGDLTVLVAPFLYRTQIAEEGMVVASPSIEKRVMDHAFQHHLYDVLSSKTFFPIRVGIVFKNRRNQYYVTNKPSLENTAVHDDFIYKENHYTEDGPILNSLLTIMDLFDFADMSDPSIKFTYIDMSQETPSLYILYEVTCKNGQIKKQFNRKYFKWMHQKDLIDNYFKFNDVSKHFINFLYIEKRKEDENGTTISD